VLGVPSASAPTLAALFLSGFLVGAIAWSIGGRRRPQGLVERAVAVACAAAVVSLPYVGWRIVEDIRYTHRLDPYDRRAAGPIQAYLPGYLADGVAAVVPRDDTYATVVSSTVPYATARKAFPSLVLTTLFPRVSAPLRKAQWVVDWGVKPSGFAHVGRIVVASPQRGPLPPIYVARLRR
jgi:hypothetical protein